MSEWKEVRLGEWMQFNPSRTIKKGHMARKIPMDSLVPYSKTIDKYYYEPYKGGAKFQNGDTIMARITPCLENGKHAFISLLDQNETAFGSTEYIVMCGIEGISDNDFVYYLTHTPFFKNHAIKSMVGSSGRQRAQVDVLQNLIMLVPTSLIEQRRIAAFLSSLDSKIENNRKICANLEAQAQALFKHWFIDFAPFKDGKFVESELGRIPEGWSILPIDKVFNIKYGKNLPTSKIEDKGDYPVYGANGIMGYYSLYNYDSYVTLITSRGSGSGDVSRTFQEKTFVTNNSFAVTPQENYSFMGYGYTYYCIKNINFKPYCSGSAQPQLTNSSISAISILIPNYDVIIKFNSFVSYIHREVNRVQIECDRLKTLRDSLLPKLMSGEIIV